MKTDGSRVLMITMNIGGMETTMSLEISKPTNMQNDNAKQEADSSDRPFSESDINMKDKESKHLSTNPPFCAIIFELQTTERGIFDGEYIRK